MKKIFVFVFCLFGMSALQSCTTAPCRLDEGGCMPCGPTSPCPADPASPGGPGSPSGPAGPNTGRDRPY